MEAYSTEHHRQSSISSSPSSKLTRSQRNRRHRSFNFSTAVPRPTEDSVPTSALHHHVGLFSGDDSFNNQSTFFFPNHQSWKQQPPLLPLPAIPKVQLSSSPPPNSCGQKKPNRLARHGSLLNPSKSSITRQGSVHLPDPNELPKGIPVSKVPNLYPLLAPPGLSSSVFDLAPPPSSLPLPTFSVRPKLGCNVEAEVIDDSGATDGPRRLLRLR
ncbi:hypothetical protein SAY86_011248 [Trapa natans]|uniref:Uncharacterized protein n=1 Tax=Trapa natans TaxID=22666 RepID=A0AAN7R419_TRANT|nr:hypothetical protein SAY86_011248 [Trapa natans]